MINKQLLKDSLGWGFLLWLIGYILGIAFFFFVPVSMIGWIVGPIALIITILVLLNKVKGDSLGYYFALSIVWTAIAIVFDYFLIVKAFNPPDGYYKLDVFLYYALTFVLPLIAHLLNKSE